MTHSTAAIPLRRWRRPIGVLVLALAISALYLDRLDYSPIHLHYDEVFFGLQAHAIGTTGHDLNGRRLPVYFQLDDTANWYQPAAVYWTTAVLAVVPLSDGAIRLPTALLGVVNVLLLFGVARRILRSDAWALVAALLLALTPAHFIHSRLAMDYLYPLPFTLAWLWCLLAFLERGTPRLLFAATSFLGLGFFTYIAAAGLMPIYLALTCLALLREPAPVRLTLIAAAGFAWPLLALLPFLLSYPDVIVHLMSKYHIGEGLSGLDPLQQLRESINIRTVSDRLNQYHRYFSPGYLFVSGGSNLTNSTREAGVFLFPVAVFLALGIYRVLVTAPRVGLILLAGFLTAPLPALVLPEDFAIDRELTLLPFGVLLAMIGLEHMWSARLSNVYRWVYWLVGGLGLAVGLGYAGLTLLGRGPVSASTLLLMFGSVAVLGLGVFVERTRRWWPVVCVLLLVASVQFLQFRADYFGGYRPRASEWFGGNIRGAVEMVIRLHDEGGQPPVFLSSDIPYIRSYWRFYLEVYNRQALSKIGTAIDARTFDVGSVPSGGLLLTNVTDVDAAARARRGDFEVAGMIGDPSDPDSGQAERTQFVIYRRIAAAGR